MIELTNVSHGTLRIDSMDKILHPGDRIVLDMSSDNLLASDPEFAIYVSRGHIHLYDIPMADTFQVVSFQDDETPVVVGDELAVDDTEKAVKSSKKAKKLKE